MKHLNENQDAARREVETRKPYVAPRVTEHGSLEAITKGGVDPVPPLGWIS
jgi:hypothetical protein